jgi:predicted negative regulator of RcsB-dependent stress response
VEHYRTEEEQVEALKRWWRENGRSTVVAVVVAVALGLGWQGWQRSREAAAQDTALRYQALLEALGAAEAAAAGEQAATGADPRELARALRDAQPGSVYGRFAALHLAQLAVQDGDPETAVEQLRWVADEASGSLRELAQLRLARVQAARGETDAALALLAADAVALAPAYALARGDVLLAAGRRDEALAAYREAAATIGDSAVMPRSLREKIDYLSPIAPTVAGTPADPAPAVTPVTDDSEAG